MSIAEIRERWTRGVTLQEVFTAAPKDIGYLLAEVDLLHRVTEAVSALHRPIRVYDECDHKDCQAIQIEVLDYMACADSVIGWGCQHCCYNEEYPLEDCPHDGDHHDVKRDDSCPTNRILTPTDSPMWRVGGRDS